MSNQQSLQFEFCFPGFIPNEVEISEKKITKDHKFRLLALFKKKERKTN